MIKEIRYNWYIKNNGYKDEEYYDGATVGKEHWSNGRKMVKSITDLDDSFFINYEDGSKMRVYNINTVLYS